MTCCSAWADGEGVNRRGAQDEVSHKMRTLLLSFTVLAIVGCQKAAGPDRAAKLEQVRATAAERAPTGDRKAIAAATPVLEIKDLPHSVVGLRVPLDNSSKTVFVTFEVDHFDTSSVEQLATEALADYALAKDGGRRGG